MSDQQSGRRTLGDRLSPRSFRFFMNRFPAFRGVGGRVESISDDWSRWRIRIKLGFRNRNYVGTLWGGAMAAAPDPFLMLAFMRLLGRDHVVWDKAATIRFRRPARGDLWCTIAVTPEMVAEVRAAVAREGKVDRTYPLQLVDAEGVVHAELEKVLHFSARSGA